MATDARVRYTRMVIRESFIQLNAEKPISQITVKEICEMAGINRSTFYRNFVDVYDLRDWIEDDMLQRIIKFISDKRLEGSETTVLSILQAMYEQRNRYVKLHNTPSHNLLRRILQEVYEDKKNYLASYISHLNERERKWFFDYISVGAAFVMIDWVKNGMQESPEDVARFIGNMIQGNAAALRPAD